MTGGLPGGSDRINDLEARIESLRVELTAVEAERFPSVEMGQAFQIGYTTQKNLRYPANALGHATGQKFEFVFITDTAYRHGTSGKETHPLTGDVQQGTSLTGYIVLGELVRVFWIHNQYYLLAQPKAPGVMFYLSETITDKAEAPGVVVESLGDGHSHLTTSYKTATGDQIGIKNIFRNLQIAPVGSSGGQGAFMFKGGASARGVAMWIRTIPETDDDNVQLENKFVGEFQIIRMAATSPVYFEFDAGGGNPASYDYEIYVNAQTGNLEFRQGSSAPRVISWADHTHPHGH